MKIKLLSLLFVGISAFAQSPITHYQGTLEGIPGTTFSDGLNWRIYNMYESATALNHAPTGANATWNFTGMTNLNTSNEYKNQAPTANEIAAFPTATKRTDFTSGGNLTGVEFTSTNGSSIVALQNSQFSLIYTNPASLGTFPLNYGYSNTDAVAGTYEYDTYAGTFSGNIVTTFDAYGTLVDNQTTTPIAVTRLKTVQTLNIAYSPFGNVGTVVITSYFYYHLAADSPARFWPLFKSTNTTISVPLLGVNESLTLLERQNDTFLASPEFAKKANVTLSPNPANGVVNLAFADGFSLKSTTISDLTGKTVLAKIGQTAGIDVSGLHSGIYIMTLTSDVGSETHKFIKN
ncbi:T9SS type A sorting domain-containing protein [Flavobacterium sp.]|uniref:T9SS type A sorting domain-containing protein n=1 Tax=Flavobacterium sp. TaxID=239 RepID=UPI00120B0EC1|nr:T9SS type A sorting domain-containing protein [Flavobacterium sp.]RZJ71393.1 MAG: T9SS type A sorting domain-containing protein [Flavobacterium sp.]